MNYMEKYSNSGFEIAILPVSPFRNEMYISKLYDGVYFHTNTCNEKQNCERMKQRNRKNCILMFQFEDCNYMQTAVTRELDIQSTRRMNIQCRYHLL